MHVADAATSPAPPTLLLLSSAEDDDRAATTTHQRRRRRDWEDTLVRAVAVTSYWATADPTRLRRCAANWPRMSALDNPFAQLAAEASRDHGDGGSEKASHYDAEEHEQEQTQAHSHEEPHGWWRGQVDGPEDRRIMMPLTRAFAEHEHAPFDARVPLQIQVPTSEMAARHAASRPRRARHHNHEQGDDDTASTHSARASLASLPSDLLDHPAPAPSKLLLAAASTHPTVPDMRFEQNYLRSIRDAGSWRAVAWITLRDQLVFPFAQGMLWTLLQAGYRHWNAGTARAGKSLGQGIRGWWRRYVV
ncbi:hypothetical protein KEM52_006467 [Ascosphaera acerosa]|nr:hypothetical protein KEM52_006467 [Ascosphaera acerosa]